MIRSKLPGFALACIAIALYSDCNRAFGQEDVSQTTVDTLNEHYTASEPELRMVVELADGSRVVGTPAMTELSLVAKVGTIRIPLKIINTVTIGPADRDAVVSFANGDRLSGVIEQTTFNLEATWGKLALSLPQIRTMTVQVTGSKWSLRKDFSTTNNPSGPWSYGWTSEPGGKLMLYRNQFHQEGPHGWRVESSIPGLWINEGDHEMFGVQPQEVSMHPGANGEEAIARWQAAKSCTIVVKGTFGAGDSGSVDVRIRHNATVLFESLDTKKDEPFLLEISVKSGDFVDFAVSAGRNGCSNDNTPLDAVISVK